MERYQRCSHLSHCGQCSAYVFREVCNYRLSHKFLHKQSIDTWLSILPAIAYTLDMYRRTGEFYGINEGLFSSALAAMVFSILGAQPLTIVGITGLISLFNYTIYDIVTIYEPSIYPNFMCWTAIWAAIFHWIVALCNICDYMRYVTDFSSESFGMYVGIIYISKWR